MSPKPTKTKTQVKYQNQPHGAQRCGLCSMFVKPEACTLVKGTIYANGWCKEFEWKEMEA